MSHPHDNPVHNPRVHGYRVLGQPSGASSSGRPLMRIASAHGHQPFRPLPSPTGNPPYHLDLADLLPVQQMVAITTANRLVFHLVGDSGGVQTPLPQMNVARRMEQDFTDPDPTARPAFFYHLGDVVYFYGESVQYYPQFYEPYEGYPGVIVGIPGNHDGDLSPAMQTQGVPSLAAFTTNFCARTPFHTPDALDAPRLAMTQPNVYWTLQTPYAAIIGLYTNVPEGGQLDDAQIAWLQDELTGAPRDRFLLVAMHHPIYSLDDYYSGSATMHGILNDAVARSGRTPDAVFAGHVHNYQRFTRVWNGRNVPFVVAGGGGYHNLHKIAPGVAIGSQPSPADQVTYEAGNDQLFGYLRLEVTPTTLTGAYFAVPGFVDPHAPPTVPPSPPFDTFSITLP
ncbi:MAG TPA: metallophosphoesterase [Chloroflexota bacterium]|nr:metallophosphoesterase [Chloroflexota bacterium]